MTTAELLAKEQARAKRESLELALLQAIRAHKLPEPWKQFKFHPRRRWRFDFCWTNENVAVEVDGGTHTGGRHTRGAGYAADCDKLNEAILLGWRVLRVTGEHIKSGQAIEWIRRGLES